jgi:hypothetical protein
MNILSASVLILNRAKTNANLLHINLLAILGHNFVLCNLCISIIVYRM